MTSFTITGTTTTAQTLINTETGFVGVNGAIVTSFVAIEATDFVRLNILGSVTSFGSLALNHSGSQLRFDIGATGNIVSLSSDAIRSSFVDIVRFTNSGTISAFSDAVDLRASDAGGVIYVNNFGTMNGGSDGVVLQSGDSSTFLTNSGVIEGQAYGIFNAFSSQSGTSTIVNTGTIIGRTAYSYGGDDSTELIRNSGLMIGDVDLDGGNDTYIGRGGSVVGQVFGELGDDTMIGGDASDSFSGDEGADLLKGGGGNDELLGGLDNDVVAGGDGNDTVSGNEGNDTLFGNAGEDSLFGGSGTDRLNGGSGDDDLTGGLDQDVMFGGSGADTFIYTTINDSATGSPNDAILDFEHGIDRIDLSAFAGDLDFVGGGSFTGGGTGSVRYSVNPKGHAVVRIDSDGDGIEDMRVILLYTPLLDADDFLL